MQLYVVRLISVVVIALVYMIFDVFNKRNVPTFFAYATLIYGAILTALYLNYTLILESGAIALLVLGIGFITYKIGQLGAADVIEFAALSLILPIQPIPLILKYVPQLGLPFMLSLLVNTGIIALIIVPIYYLPIARRKLKKPLLSFVENKNIFLAVSLFVIYIAFIIFAEDIVGLTYLGIGILVLMVVSSSSVMLFSIPITYSMIKEVNVDKFEEGDIIATNLMEQRNINAIKMKVKDFDRLVTNKMIKQLKEKKIKEKMPVYKEAMPFALPIFIALIFSLLAGNIILLILKL